MKNPRISLLTITAVAVVCLTLGIFIGRNFSGGAMTLSVPEEMKLPPPAAAPISESASVSGEVFFPIDINTATLTQLTALPGIGEGLAGDIIAYREANGGFSHPEELMNVSGIGENRLEAILALITVGGIQ